MQIGSFNLYDYQVRGLEMARKAVAGLNRPARVVVVAPTGAGKTVVALALIQLAVEKGTRVGFITSGRQLILQMARTMEKAGVRFSVLMAQCEYRHDKSAQVQLVSKETLQARPHRLGESPTIWIVDEADVCLSEKWQEILCDAQVVLGFTATPCRANGKGMGPFYQDLVEVATYSELLAKEKLCPIKCFAPSQPDLKGVKTTGYDYNQQQLSGVMNTDTLIGDIYKWWWDITKGERPTFVFTVDVEHAVHVSKVFNGHGVRAEWVSGDTGQEERDRIFAGLESGDIRVVASCGVLTRGVDVPCVSCAVLAKPSKSLRQYMQMCLDLQTEILTDGGWRTVDTIQKTDQIAQWDSSTEEISWSQNLGVVRREVHPTEKMISISSPHLNLRVTDTHDMFYRTPDGPWRKSPAGDLLSRKSTFQVPIAGVQSSGGVDLTDDQLRFIGWWLTDGSYNRANKQMVIYQSAASPDEHHASIIQSISGSGMQYKVYSYPRRDRFSGYAPSVTYSIPMGKDNGFRGWWGLREYLDKDFPLALEEVTPRQLEVLLHAIYLGDGTKPKTADWTIRTRMVCTCRKLFADRLQSLCVRRGIRCNVTTETPTPGLAINSTATRYMIRFRSGHHAARIRGSNVHDGSQLGVVLGPSNEQVWCVTTELGSLVTRRHGKVSILGNCGRILRTHPSKSDAILIDHAGAVVRHGWPTQDRDWDLNPRERIEEREKPKDTGENMRTCPNCGVIWEWQASKDCPNCGYKKTRKGVATLMEDGTYQQLDEKKLAKKKELSDQQVWKQCLGIAANKNMSVAQAQVIFKSKQGKWPNGIEPTVAPEDRYRKASQVFPNYCRKAKA